MTSQWVMILLGMTIDCNIIIVMGTYHDVTMHTDVVKSSFIIHVLLLAIMIFLKELSNSVPTLDFNPGQNSEVGVP